MSRSNTKTKLNEALERRGLKLCAQKTFGNHPHRATRSEKVARIHTKILNLEADMCGEDRW